MKNLKTVVAFLCIVIFVLLMVYVTQGIWKPMLDGKWLVMGMGDHSYDKRKLLEIKINTQTKVRRLIPRQEKEWKRAVEDSNLIGRIIAVE